ncbi:MAG: hypothetical protein ABI333_25170 [bacterium]
MSARKCSSCGTTTQSSVPFCSNCGALFPVGDENEIMRQAIGASFDVKWVIIGGLIAILLQGALMGALLSVWGKKILVGEKGRSLLDVNLDAISPGWGANSGGTRVTLTIKPDNKNINTAQQVLAVMFAGVKAKRFHIQHLQVMRKECNHKCQRKIKANQIYKECVKVCDKVEIEAEKKAVEACWRPCEALDEDKELTPEKKEKQKIKLGCAACDKRLQAYGIRKRRCDSECPKKKSVADSEEGRCSLCRKQMPVFQARAKQCEAKVTDCWAFRDDRGRQTPPKVPQRSAYKSDKDHKKAIDQYNLEVEQTKKDNKARAARERKQLRTFVNVYTPSVPGKVGLVPVKIIFKSGEELVKYGGYYFVPPEKKDDKSPDLRKEKRTLHDPVRTLGFWILLLGSCVFYFFGGFAVGRFSPGIGPKEPLTAAIFAWLAFEVIIFFIGAAGSAQMFTAFIGAPAFVGAALVGAALGEHTADA